MPEAEPGRINDAVGEFAGRDADDADGDHEDAEAEGHAKDDLALEADADFGEEHDGEGDYQEVGEDVEGCRGVEVDFFTVHH